MRNATFLLSLLSLATTQAHATSLHPCTPTVEAAASQMHCKGEGDQHYFIMIHTLMSPNTPNCQGENHYEYKTATVEMSNFTTGEVLDTLTIYDSEFSYSLSLSPGPSFDSDKYSLHLNRCVAPMHGGLSVGN